MRPPPDPAALAAGLQRVLARVGGGLPGPPDLTPLLDAIATALGAAGVTLAEHRGSATRVAAGTGAAAWAVGWLAPDPPAGPVWESTLDPAGGELAARLHDFGLRHVIGTRVGRPGAPDGSLSAYFTTDEVTGPAYHRLLVVAGAVASALYLYPEPAPGPEAAAVPPHRGWAAPVPAPPDDRDLFLAMASHELRTPITVIKGFADIVDRNWDLVDPAARRDAVRLIGKRADELARLVDRLLVVTESTAAGLACRPFDLVAALREAAAGLRDDLRARLAVRLPRHLPEAYGDPATISPVLTELVTNAVRYSADQVGLRADSDDRSVRFRVTDRGPGIAPEDAERAFARYWQAPSAERGRQGVGLGLHLVRRIVERQGGWVSLRPRRAGGTVAEIALLRADVAKTDRT